MTTGERHADLPVRDGDLVEFLLARFDEDEEAARFVQLSRAPSNRALVAHVLRDVAAKRQLVEYFRDLERQGPDRDAGLDQAGGGAAGTGWGSGASVSRRGCRAPGRRPRRRGAACPG
jgi:hypothetical protein